MSSELFRIPTDFINHIYDDGKKLPDYRSVFMRDRDRIMYCTAFRRLAGKTQIYTIGADDHKKNRLTHSLEVSQIARTIASALGLNEALAEAIALAHDFGHTPFGHAGEQMLHEIMTPNAKYVRESPFYHQQFSQVKLTYDREEDERIKEIININNMFGFKHNIQSVRVAALLEDSYRSSKNENIGLNLTNFTLWGMMNHSKLKYSNTDPFPNYQNSFNRNIKIKGAECEAWSLEAFVVRTSDDIAQWHHDLEDAIRGDAMPIDKICNIIKEAIGDKLDSSDNDLLSSIETTTKIDRKCLAELSHIVINTLINDIVETSQANIKRIEEELSNKFSGEEKNEISKSLFIDYEKLGLSIPKDSIIAFSQNIHPDRFKSEIMGSVHYSRNVERMNEKGKYIIRKLFEAYCSHPQQLPDGPILHFMIDIKKYDSIEDARTAGMGAVRILFDEIWKNPKMPYRALLMRRICDHIACMTDRYAIEEYKNLYG